jgi:hypothetical protein
LKLGTLKDCPRKAQSQELSPEVDEKSSKPKGLLYAPVIRVSSRRNLFHLHRSVRREEKEGREASHSTLKNKEALGDLMRLWLDLRSKDGL